ncbi:MAG: hypothetical protein CMJ71_05170 [Planctomycetaceae bacterium]|nr:hypothetical protein [Planctomycetaceae bacterium]
METMLLFGVAVPIVFKNINNFIFMAQKEGYIREGVQLSQCVRNPSMVDMVISNGRIFYYYIPVSELQFPYHSPG